ncbi:Hypp854 [Branchiostoma lanceolatum]|uniref:Hypp854 protein n=1 Tax=Branchiostoma lanceolatum TaxID=7740 RepID=A0A8J9VCT7_BRALA|nr:Hypp854 [Branchiostoma lanceolatum]
MSAPTTDTTSSLKERIIDRLSQFESYQNNPAWQADRIAEIATNNAPSTLESLKEVRQELFDSIESLPHSPDDLSDGRLVRRNKNSTQRFTLIKDIIALFNFSNSGEVSKDLKDCIRPNQDNGSSSQSYESDGVTLVKSSTSRKGSESLDDNRDHNVSLPIPANVCFLCGSASCCESDPQAHVCEHCKMLPETVKCLVDRIKQLECQVHVRENETCNAQDDLAREVQRLRDENASLLQIIQVLSNERTGVNKPSNESTDVNKPSQWCHVNEGRSTRRHNKPTCADETIRTTNRFSVLDCPDDVQLVSSEECDSSIIEEDNQIYLYRKQQQQRFYQSKAPEKTVIIGDSMIKHLKPNRMSRGRNVKCFTHRGARIEQLVAPARRIVSSENPHSVIIHAGTNNNQDSVQAVIDKTHNLTTTLRETGARNIAVSGVISRADTDPERTHLINLGLAGLCTSNGMTFIDNSNIGPHYLCTDGVHLNNRGTIQLAMNLISFIRGEKQQRIRVGTSYSDAVRSPTATTVDFHGRGAPSSRWKFRTAEQTRLLRMAERMWD